MTLPTPPDLLHPRRRLYLAALVVTLVVGLVSGLRDAPGLARSFGDTDDAMRMVLVKGLLHGQGWWDQHLMRLQPPLGVYMHWSRLLDGGIAALNAVFALFLTAPEAEWMTRLIWPLLWVFPAALAALVLAGALGAAGRTSASPVPPWICLFFLVTNYGLYIQFHPGRVDHHDVQMTLFFLALAGASARRARVKGALLSGVATGLGLAIGLEALVFDAVVGLSFAFRFLQDPKAAAPLRTYGLALAATTLIAFGVQTPPWRWGVAACDALAVNSAIAAATAGLGVAAAGRWLAARGQGVRLIGLGLAGAAAAAAYVGLDPACLRGPFADVNPAIKVFWLSHVQEMRPWPTVMRQHPEDAILLSTAPIMGAGFLIWIARRREARQDGVLRLIAAELALSMIAGFNGMRMAGYADWIAVAAIAAGAAEAAEGLSLRLRIAPVLAASILALITTPFSASAAATRINQAVGTLMGAKGAKARPQPGDHCFDTRAYTALAKAGPPGLVLSEIDLGPFVLANTGDSVLAAPYHRMSWGMIAARKILSADAGTQAETAARALDVRYVLECRAHARQSDRSGMAVGSLQRRLDAGGPTPSWLAPVGSPSGPLEVFAVRPALTGSAPTSPGRALQGARP